MAEGTEATVNMWNAGSNYEYSFNSNGPWQDVTGSTSLSIASGNTKVYFRANSSADFSIKQGNSFVAKASDGLVRIGGDILTLLNQNPRQNQMGDEAFKELFSGCSGIVDASQLKLPDYVTPRCYYRMFNNCTNLKSAPNLPATELADACYLEMFYYCISLTTAPNLPATTLADKCYERMFQNCSSLNEVHVGLTSIEFTSDTHPMDLWLAGTARSGTVYCTQELFDETEASGAQPHVYLRYPEGWTYAVDKPAPGPNPKPVSGLEIDRDTFKSDAPAHTVIASEAATNDFGYFDLKVHKPDERTKANQAFLVRNYIGANAKILLTENIYPRRDLSTIENGSLQTLTWGNLPKNQLGAIKAVVYNQTDKAYVINGILDANGTATFTGFKLRPASTITICK